MQGQPREQPQGAGWQPAGALLSHSDRELRLPAGEEGTGAAHRLSSRPGGRGEAQKVGRCPWRQSEGLKEPGRKAAKGGEGSLLMRCVQIHGRLFEDIYPKSYSQLSLK